MTETILFAANRGYALTSSREAIITRFIQHGWNVVLATSDDEESRYLAALGAQLEPVTFHRGGLSIGADSRAYHRMRAICKKWRPALVHNFHAKPVMISTLAAHRILGDQVKIINTITGLGHAFIAGKLTARLAGVGYRLALPRSDTTVFQNRDDQMLFLQKGWLPANRARLIAGSGVDIEHYAVRDRKGRDKSKPVIIMLGRLLRQKGIPEFVEVSREIRKQWPEARFLLAGEEDVSHPDAVNMEWLREQDSIEYLGRLSDVQPLLESADLLLFPSYYREGVPRVVMEAAACGLPTVAYDVPGVREAVRDKVTGYLVPAKRIDALINGVTDLLQNAERRLEMGVAARQFAEKTFDVRVIQEHYFSLYRELGVSI